MARNTPEELIAVLETELNGTQVTPYLTSAGVYVNAALAGAALSEEVLKEIELWLAAHLLASSRERMARKEGAGGAYIEYAGEYGEGLKSTPYGHMALMLDSSGTLAAAGKKAIKFTAIKE